MLGTFLNFLKMVGTRARPDQGTSAAAAAKVSSEAVATPPSSPRASRLRSRSPPPSPSDSTTSNETLLMPPPQARAPSTPRTRKRAREEADADAVSVASSSSSTSRSTRSKSRRPDDHEGTLPVQVQGERGDRDIGDNDDSGQEETRAQTQTDGVLVALHGRNEVPFVKFDEWTKSISLDFPNLKANLVLNRLIVPGLKGHNLPENFCDVRDEIGDRIGRLCLAVSSPQYIDLHMPIVVQVLAKKKSYSVFMSDSTVLFFGPLLVADGTGVCPLTCINEAVERVYDAVDVGDVMLIERASLRQPKSVGFGVGFGTGTSNTTNNSVDKSSTMIQPFEPFLMNVEIKMDKYAVRRNKILKVKDHPEWVPKFADYLFPGETCNLWTPSELEKRGRQYAINESEKLNLSLSQMFGLGSPDKSQSHSQSQRAKMQKSLSVFGDVIGVVNYVGRVERMERKKVILQTLGDSSEEGSERTKKEIRVWISYRWIQIVDKDSKPLSLQLYARKENEVLDRKELVPGAIIMISHCDFKGMLGESLEPVVTTSVFSMTYLNEEIKKKYLVLLPIRYTSVAVKSVMGLSHYTSIICRKEVPWSAGGTLHLPARIIDESEYLRLYWEKREEEAQEEATKTIAAKEKEKDKAPSSSSGCKKLHRQVPPDHELLEREMFHVQVRGKITRVLEILEKDAQIHGPNVNAKPNAYFSMHKWIVGQEDRFWKERRLRKKNPWYRNQRSCVCSSCKELQWLSLSRSLPQPKIPDRANKTSEIVKAITKQQRRFCDPLVRPNSDSKVDPTALPLTELNLANPFDFFIVSILDEETNCEYDARWDTYTLEEMRAKCKAVEGKTIIAMIDIFKCHNDAKPYDEVVLRDFAIDKENKPSSSSIDNNKESNE